LNGSQIYQTPNIDALAKQSVVFNNAYTNYPRCVPSRYAMMTGNYPVQNGDVPDDGFEMNNVPDEKNFVKNIKASGYQTAYFGKWHLGTQKGMLPNEQGFDYSFGHYVGCIDNYSHFFYWNGPTRHDLYRNGQEIFFDGEFFPDLMVNETIKFIETNKDDSFFVYFATNMPHYPYQGDEKWLKYYQDMNIDMIMFIQVKER